MVGKQVSPLQPLHLINISRRALLAGVALSFAGIHSLPSSAAEAPSTAEVGFFTLSSVVTAKKDLDPITSRRIMEALVKDDPEMAGRIAKLVDLTKDHADATALKGAATAIGLDGDVMKIVTAWYTGTITTKTGPVVVAYKDALMYRPVADGLTVPTYCNKGPMWWTALPPEISRIPINNPKVL